MDIRKTAHLARIALSDEEADRYGKQLDQILDYVRQLEELDVDHIEPTAHAMPVYDVMREDTATCTSLDREAVLANAPATAQDQIKMPKVVD